MASKSRKISKLIESQLPGFISSDYEKFGKFIEKYYEQLETTGSPLDILNNIETYRDINFYEKNLLQQKTNLSQSILDSTSSISVNDASSFPEENGYIRIGAEICFYKSRTNTQFLEVSRGVSGNTTLGDLYKSSEFITTDATAHYANDEVYNISNLFLYAFIKNFEEEYLGAFPEKYLKGEVDKRTLIKNINKFYKAKGTDKSIKFIFNSIVSKTENETVETYNPKDFTLKASVSDWTTKYALKAKILSGDPLKLIGNIITQSLDSYDKSITFASAVVDNVLYLGKYDNEDIYEIVLSPSTINGNFKISARTTLRSNLSLSATTKNRLDVFSTLGFANQGKLLVDNEVIAFNDKNVNQLIIDTRQNPSSHTQGTPVYSFSTITGVHPEGTVTLLTLGILYNLLPEKSIPYAESGDLIQISDSGFETRDPVIFDVRKNSTRWFLNTTFQKVNSIVPGVNSQVGDLNADVSAIYEDDQYYYIASSSFPSSTNLLTLETIEPLSDQKLLRLIRKYPTSTTEVYETSTRDVGILVDGSPVFGYKDFDFVSFGKIVSTKIENKGSGYSAPPTVLLNEQPGKAVSILSGETVNGISIVVADNYTNNPVVRITSGENAVLSAVVTEGRISSITVTNPGRYYSSPPRIRIIDEVGKGKFAEYTAVLDTEGRIESCNRISGGRFYTRGNVTITVESEGLGAQATAKIKQWVKNRYRKLQSKLDTNNSYVFPDFGGTKKYGYGVVANPVILRRRLNDNITSTYQESNSISHSPILGYAYDGNPIYGPYGHSMPTDALSSIVRLSSGYSLRATRLNGPSTTEYPLGSFIDDYVWVPTVNSGKTELDQNNGRFCVTPDYPNGVYAYFTTIDQNNVPKFPYVLGETFYSLPVDSNYNSIISQDDIPPTVKRLKTEDYEVNGNDFYGYIQDVKAGNISSATIYRSNENFSVNSFVSINSFLTDGSGATAEVSSVEGKEVLSIESRQVKANQFTTIENAYLFANDVVTQQSTGASGILIRNVINENKFVLRNIQGEFNTQNKINSQTKVINLILDKNSIFTQGAIVTLTDGKTNANSNIAVGEILEGITRQNSLKIKVISGTFSVNSNYFLKSSNLGDTSRTKIINFISLSENLTIFDVDKTVAIVETNQPHKIAVGDKVNLDVLPNDSVTETLYYVRKRLFQEAILNPVNHTSTIQDLGIGSADILNSGSDYTVATYQNVELIFQDVTKARKNIGRIGDVNNAKARIVVSSSVGFNYAGVRSITITSKGVGYRTGDILTVRDASLNRLTNSTNTQRFCYVVNHVGFADENTILKLSNVNNLSNNDYLKLNEEIVKITAVNILDKTVAVLRGEKNTRPRNHYDQLQVELFEGNYRFAPNYTPFGEGPNKPIINNYDQSTKKTIVTFNYGSQNPERILQSSSFFDSSSPAKLVTIRTTEVPKFKLEFSKNNPNNLIANPVVNIQKYYKYKFDTSHSSMVDTFLDFSTSSNYNIFTEEKLVSPISPGNPGSFLTIKLGFGPNIASNSFQNKKKLNFTNYFYFIKVSPNVNTDNSFLRVIEDPLIGEKIVTYTTDTKFVYSLGSVPEYDGSGQMTYTTTSEFAVGKINSINITNTGNDYKRLPLIDGVLPSSTKECIVDVIYDTANKNVAGFKILNQGQNYSKPKAIVTDGDGLNYKFDCFTLNGKVTKIDVINKGSNFTYKPTVKIIESDVEIYFNSNNIGIPKNVKIIRNGALFNSDKTTVPDYKSNTIFVLKNFGSTSFFQGETITQPSTGASARVATGGWRIGNNLLKVDRIKGVFKSGGTIVGVGVGREATIVDQICTKFIPELKSFYDNLGFYSSDKGKIGASSQKIVDSYFYQDYSYVIKSKTSIEVWRDLIKETTHPAGFQLFGEMQIESAGEIIMPASQKIVETSISINLASINVTVIDTTRQITNSFVNLNSFKIEKGLGAVSVDTFDSSETLAYRVKLSNPFNGDFNPSTGILEGTKSFTLIDVKTNLALQLDNSQQLFVTLDGVFQEPQSAYTVNGSTITFDSAPFGARIVEGQQVGAQIFYAKAFKFKNFALNNKYFKKLQSIQSQFDGIKKEFNLLYENGSIVKTDVNENLFVGLNGVIQNAKTTVFDSELTSKNYEPSKNSYYISRSLNSSVTDKIVFSSPPIDHEDLYEDNSTPSELKGAEKCFIFSGSNYERLTIDSSLISLAGIGPYLIVDEVEKRVRKIDESLYALVFIDGVLQEEIKSYQIIGPTITFTAPLREYVSESGEIQYQKVSIILIYGRDLQKTLTFYDFEPNTYYNIIKFTLRGDNIYQTFYDIYYKISTKSLILKQGNKVLAKLKSFEKISNNEITIRTIGHNLTTLTSENLTLVDEDDNYLLSGTYTIEYEYQTDSDGIRILAKDVPAWIFGTELGDASWKEKSKIHANILSGDKILIDGESNYREILYLPNFSNTREYNSGKYVSDQIYSKLGSTNYNGITRGEGLSIVANLTGSSVTELDWNKRNLQLYFQNNVLLQPTAYQYFTTPIIQFIPVDQNGGGAKAEVIAYNGQILDIVLLDGGYGYTKPPKVVVARGYNKIKEPNRKIDSITSLFLSPYLNDFEVIITTIIELRGASVSYGPIFSIASYGGFIGDKEPSREILITPYTTETFVYSIITYKAEINLFLADNVIIVPIINTSREITTILSATIDVISSSSIQSVYKEITREINKLVNNAIIEVPSESINDIGAFLDSPLSTTNTIVYIPDTRRFPDASRLLIGKEIVVYSTKLSDRFLNVIRGTSGTTAITHEAGDYLRHLPELISIVPVGPITIVITEVTITEVHKTNSALVKVISTSASEPITVSLIDDTIELTLNNQIDVDNSDIELIQEIIIIPPTTYLTSLNSYSSTYVSFVALGVSDPISAISSLINTIASVNREITNSFDIDVDNSDIELIQEIIIIPPTTYLTSLNSYSSTYVSVVISGVADPITIISSFVNTIVSVDREITNSFDIDVDNSDIELIQEIIIIPPPTVLAEFNLYSSTYVSVVISGAQLINTIISIDKEITSIEKINVDVSNTIISSQTVVSVLSSVEYTSLSTVTVLSTNTIIANQIQIDIYYSPSVHSSIVQLEMQSTVHTVSSIVFDIGFAREIIIQPALYIAVLNSHIITYVSYANTGVAGGIGSVSTAVNTIASVEEEITSTVTTTLDKFTNVSSSQSILSLGSNIDSSSSSIVTIVNSSCLVTNTFRVDVYSAFNTISSQLATINPTFISTILTVTNTLTSTINQYINSINLLRSAELNSYQSTTTLFVAGLGNVITSSSAIVTNNLAKNADVERFYKTGILDFAEEFFVLTNPINARLGLITLDSPFNQVRQRDNTIILVDNKSAFREEFYDSYSSGNAGFTLKIFENNAFINTGAFSVSGSIESITMAYPSLTIRDFEERGNSTITLIGSTFNFGIPTINSAGGFVSASINISQTSISVLSTRGFPSAGNLLIGKEVVSYSGKSQTTFTGVIRGINNTIPSTYAINQYLRTFD